MIRQPNVYRTSMKAAAIMQTDRGKVWVNKHDFLK